MNKEQRKKITLEAVSLCVDRFERLMRSEPEMEIVTFRRALSGNEGDVMVMTMARAADQVCGYIDLPEAWKEELGYWHISVDFTNPDVPVVRVYSGDYYVEEDVTATGRFENGRVVWDRPKKAGKAS